jgi:hypothetical protein
MKKNECEFSMNGIVCCPECFDAGIELGRGGKSREIIERKNSKCDSSEDGKHFWTSDDEDNPREIICIHCLENLFNQTLKKA